MSVWICLFLQAEEEAPLERDVYHCHLPRQGSKISSSGQFEMPGQGCIRLELFLQILPTKFLLSADADVLSAAVLVLESLLLQTDLSGLWVGTSVDLMEFLSLQHS